MCVPFRTEEWVTTERVLQEREVALAEAQQEVDRLRGLLRGSTTPLLVAHELRAPIASLLSTLDVLLQGYAADQSELREEMLRLAHTRAESMLALINDFLHLGSIRHAEIEPQAAPVCLPSVLWQVVPELRIKAMLRGVELAIDAADTPASVMGTDEHMAQLLYNLVDNAIKYTNPGGKVSVSLWEESDRVAGQVADTGVGIAARDLPRIFDEFFRGANAKEIEAYGTGLGLPIVRRVVELYDGQIDVASELGKGTTFTFSFPKIHEREPVTGA